MSHGPIMGLIMGLGQLNCSKIKLKKINYRRGLLGIDRVLHHLVKEWLNHIKNRQLPSLLQGIGPMNSIVIFCKFKPYPQLMVSYLDWPANCFFTFHSPRCHRFIPVAVRTISAWRTHCSGHSTGRAKFHLSHSCRCTGVNDAIDLLVAGMLHRLLVPLPQISNSFIDSIADNGRNCVRYGVAGSIGENKSWPPQGKTQAASSTRYSWRRHKCLLHRQRRKWINVQCNLPNELRVDINLFFSIEISGRGRYSTYHRRIGGNWTWSKRNDGSRRRRYSSNSTNDGQTDCIGHPGNDQCSRRRSKSTGARCTNRSKREMEGGRWLMVI